MLTHSDCHAATAQIAHAPPVRVTAAGHQDIHTRQKVVARHPPPLSDHRPDRFRCWLHFLRARESPDVYSSFRAEIVTRMPVNSTNRAGVLAPRRPARPPPPLKPMTRPPSI